MHLVLDLPCFTYEGIDPGAGLLLRVVELLIQHSQQVLHLTWLKRGEQIKWREVCLAVDSTY